MGPRPAAIPAALLAVRGLIGLLRDDRDPASAQSGAARPRGVRPIGSYRVRSGARAAHRSAHPDLLQHRDELGRFRLDQSVVGPGVPSTDAQWARIEPLLPDRTPKRGDRRRDRRQVIDAIAFTSRTGTQWVHLPEKSGNWRGICHRLRMWAVDAPWERVFTTLMAQADADEDLAWPYRWTPRPGALTSTLPAPGKRRGPRPTNPPTTPSAAPVADRPRRSLSLPIPAAGLWRSFSPRARSATRPPSRVSCPPACSPTA